MKHLGRRLAGAAAAAAVLLALLPSAALAAEELQAAVEEAPAEGETVSPEGLEYQSEEEGIRPVAASGTPFLSAALSDGRSLSLYAGDGISKVISVLGQPKLETVSRYGGSAYSFYTGDYEDYLYFETRPDESIALYAVIGCQFQSERGNFGGNRRYSGSVVVEACDSNDVVWGISAPCYEVTQAECSAAAAVYRDDPGCAEALTAHAAIAWNAACAYWGKSSRVVFDSRAFYMNRQLMENGSNLYQYFRAIERGDFHLISAGRGTPDTRYWYASPSPIAYARQARNYSLPEGCCLVADTYLTGDILGGLLPSYFEEGQEVPLTAEETARIQRMQNLYAESVAQWNAASSSYYTEALTDDSLPLVQGAVNPECIQAAVKFLNAVRIGAGLPELEYSPTLSDNAQCKAVLTTYMQKAGISNPNPHTPAKPDGVDDAFYEKTKPTGGENLYQGNVLTSLINALDDSAGDRITCGHRYNLLNPSYQTIGLGDSGRQGVHKFGGFNSAADVDAVCWPSQGVMMSAAGLRGGSMLTVKFYNNSYQTTGSTGVIFRCLNTGEQFTFESTLGSGSGRGLIRTGTSMVSYYDSRIAFVPGYVYEITVTHVTDGNGDSTDYTYRSVYAKVYEGGSGDAALTLSDNTLSLQEGERRKVNAAVSPEDLANKRVAWSTSDESVASVTGNGLVTARRVGTAVITAMMDNGVSAQCAVSVRKPDPVRLEAGEVTAASGRMSFPAAVENPGTAPVSGVLYAAAYRSGRMSEVQRVPVSLAAGGRLERSLTLSGESAKLFLLENGTCRPLIGAVAVK